MSSKKNLHTLLFVLCVCISLIVSAQAVDVEGAAPNAESGRAAENAESILTTANFPDENFLAALQAIFPDGLTAEGAEQVTVLDVSNMDISDLTGIEQFPALMHLNVSRNRLTALDISNNPALVELSCLINQINGLDVSQNPALIWLKCGTNQLKNLDVSNNPNLIEIQCQYNQISALDLSGNPHLRNLLCFGNELTALDLSSNPELIRLSCRENHLAALDLSANPYLAPDTNEILSVAPQMIDIGEVGDTFDLTDYAPDVDGGKIFDVQGASVDGTVFSDYEDGQVICYSYEAEYISESNPLYIEVRFSKAMASADSEPEPPKDDSDSPARDDTPIKDTENTAPDSNLPPQGDTPQTSPSEPEKPPESGNTSGGSVMTPPAGESGYSAPYEPPKRVDHSVVNPAPEQTGEPPAEAAGNEPLSMPFSDVPENCYYYDAVLWAVRQGITVGTGEMTFSPNASCSRAQLVTFLWRAAGSPEPDNAEIPFDDVPANSYYSKAVLWAREKGITTGTGNNTFSPNETVSRAQMVTMLWRMTGAEAANGENPFTDVESESYYSRAVLWAGKRGITFGTGANTFSPHADCSRSQIVTFLFRAFSE